jgi:hypothetical protein
MALRISGKDVGLSYGMRFLKHSKGVLRRARARIKTSSRSGAGIVLPTADFVAVVLALFGIRQIVNPVIGNMDESRFGKKKDGRFYIVPKEHKVAAVAGVRGEAYCTLIPVSIASGYVFKIYYVFKGTKAQAEGRVPFDVPLPKGSPHAGLRADMPRRPS